MESTKEALLNIYEVAKAAKITPWKARQLIVAKVFEPYTYIKRGSMEQPVFRASDIDKILDAIKKHAKKMAA